MTQHHVEVFIDSDRLGSRLVCEDEANCSETKPDYRDKHGCAVREWYENDGPDLIDFNDQVLVGRVAVRCHWDGFEDDAELSLRPFSSP
jgi:hypothetical protein